MGTDCAAVNRLEKLSVNMMGTKAAENLNILMMGVPTQD